MILKTVICCILRALKMFKSNNLSLDIKTEPFEEISEHQVCDYNIDIKEEFVDERETYFDFPCIYPESNEESDPLFIPGIDDNGEMNTELNSRLRPRKSAIFPKELTSAPNYKEALNVMAEECSEDEMSSSNEDDEASEFSEPEISQIPKKSKKLKPMKTLGTTVQCPVCWNDYTERWGMIRHARLQHPEYVKKHPELMGKSSSTEKTDKPPKCPVCLKTFFRSFEMRRHCRRLHPKFTKENPTIVPTSTAPKPTGRYPYKICKESGLFICVVEHCAWSGKTRSLFRAHMSSHHSSLLEEEYGISPVKARKTETKFPEIPLNPKGFYSCLIASCSLEFQTKEEARRHMISQHWSELQEEFGLNLRKKLVKKGEYECQICRTVLSTANSLKQHIAIRHTSEPKQFLCSDCGASFICSKYLRRHEKVHSEQTDSFKCQQCGKGFTRRSSWKRHVQLVHPPDCQGPLQCQECGIQVGSLKKLEQHVKRAHQDLRPHECQLCKKTFKEVQHLRNHIKTHGLGKVKNCKKKSS